MGSAEDGTLYFRKNRNQYTIEIEQKIPSWLESVAESIENVFRIRTRTYKTSKGYFRLVIFSKIVYNEMLKFRKDPTLVFNETRSFRKGYLRGVFDAEGSVHKDRYSIRFASKRMELIDTVKKLLLEFQIKTGKVYEDKTANVLPIYGKENLKRFHNNIGFYHQEKQERLSNLISV